MAQVADIDTFYAYVQSTGKLRTIEHAQRWSAAVLNALSLNLDRGTKKRLARALPSELAQALTRVFYLAHFRNPNLSLEEFLSQVSRRGGNTDTLFARYPTQAVFGGLKQLIGEELSDQVARSLSPEVRALWRQA